MDLQLAGRVAVVTGGASGIGRACARGFAAEGAHVALWDFSPSVQDQALALAETCGITARGYRVDITDESAVNAIAKQTQRDFGRIDHVVHSAAIGSGKFGFPFTNLQPAEWLRTVQVNIMGMVHVAHAVAPLLTQQTGTIVSIASVAGQIGSQTDPPYSATKAANINFAQCLAKDLAPRGIRVNTVCPGMVQTPLNRGVWQAWQAQAAPAERLSYEDWAAKKIAQVVPLGKWQTPEAIADMVVFLSSSRAEHVTGQTINVDGGFVMHW